MPIRTITYCAVALAVMLLNTVPAAAMDFGNVMNPSKWFGGGNNDDYYDDWGPGYGGPPPPPYGAPGYGAPGFAPGYPGGYGAPGYGYPGAGYGMPGQAPPTYSAPEAAGSEDDLEVERLKRRVRELEEEQRRTGSMGGQQQYQAPSGPYGGQQQYPPPGGYGAQQQYAPQGGYGGGQQYAPQSGYGSGGQQGYGAQQPGPGGASSAGQSNRWYYREDSSLPPMSDQ